MNRKIFHCNICDCNVASKCRLRHLRSKKHMTHQNSEESEDDTNKKKCRQCHKLKEINEFRNDNLTCNHCLDVRNEYKRNNPEKTAEWKKKHFEKIKDETYRCELCDCSLKKYKKGQHEKGIGHKYLLELKERGEEMEQPDRISIDKDGTESYDCFSCKASFLKNAWPAHLVSNLHLKSKLEK